MMSQNDRETVENMSEDERETVSLNTPLFSDRSNNIFALFTTWALFESFQLFSDQIMRRSRQAKLVQLKQCQSLSTSIRKSFASLSSKYMLATGLKRISRSFRRFPHLNMRREKVFVG